MSKGVGRPITYTEEFIRKELTSLLAELKKDESVFFLNQLFERKDYSKQRYHEWRDKMIELGDEETVNKFDKITEILEARVVVGGLTSILNPTMSIFHLKNNYAWVDKKVVEQTNHDGDALTPEKEAEIDKAIGNNNVVETKKPNKKS